MKFIFEDFNGNRFTGWKDLLLFGSYLHFSLFHLLLFNFNFLCGFVARTLHNSN